MAAATIYFDNAATTPMDPRVMESMRPFLNGLCGNPSSLHLPGRQAREAVEKARAQVAALLNATPAEIVFTGSGTEADNLALSGTMAAVGEAKAHLVTSRFEHPAVLATCTALERRGVAVTRLPATSDGLIEPSSLVAALRPETRLVSIMAANNVVGTVQPVAELARIASEAGALFHTDAVQAAGRIPLDVRAAPIDLLSMSAHKLHGPKGVGALFVRKGTPLAPLIHGGGQERGLRSATENVAGIVGFGCACEIARLSMAEEAVRVVAMRDALIDGILAGPFGAYLIGDRYRRLPGHVCIGLSGREGEAMHLLLALDAYGIAVSTGSACSAHHAGTPSETLLAMGLDAVRARGSLRITLGRFNTTNEVERFLEVLPKAVEELRTITTQTQKTGNGALR